MNNAVNPSLVAKARNLEEELRSQSLIQQKRFLGKDCIPIIIQLRLVPISVANKAQNEENASKFANELIRAGIIQQVSGGNQKAFSKGAYSFVTGYHVRRDSKDELHMMALKEDQEIPAKKLMQVKQPDEFEKEKQGIHGMAHLDEPSMTFSVSNTKVAAEIEEKHHDALIMRRQQSEADIQVQQQQNLFGSLKESLSQHACTVIVFGASGHLAKTKTYPALYDLFCEGVFPDDVNIVGYARSKLSKKDFDKKISIKLKGNTVSMFLERCTYFAGKGYDDDASYQALAEYIKKLEGDKYNGRSNRVAYLATPPTVFVAVSERIQKYLKVDKKEEGDHSWMRVIIEKPFGKDLASSNKLAEDISLYLQEEEVYRIDHYLAKEMVQNIIVFRFANTIWDTIWNRKYIRCVKISMKETAALDGRGGYYDEYGVIRDVLQNHLLQVLTLIAMEQPCSLRSEDVRDEKVKVLKCVKPMDEQRTVVGQYSKSADGKKFGYRDDPSIKNSDNPNSNQITFVQTVLFVDSARWAGVPFICKCGKGLDAKNTEVRIQFKNDGLCLFPDANFNEIVMRLQPNEAIWCKINTKTPGFARFDTAQPFELDITYKNRFGPLKLPEAYTRLILDTLEGDQSLFVRADELREAWRIVTPFLHKLEKENKDPQKYPRGSRGPPQADSIAQQYGFQQSLRYHYKQHDGALKGNL